MLGVRFELSGTQRTPTHAQVHFYFLLARIASINRMIATARNATTQPTRGLSFSIMHLSDDCLHFTLSSPFEAMLQWNTVGKCILISRRRCTALVNRSRRLFCLAFQNKINWNMRFRISFRLSFRVCAVHNNIIQLTDYTLLTDHHHHPFRSIIDIAALSHTCWILCWGGPKSDEPIDLTMNSLLTTNSTEYTYNLSKQSKNNECNPTTFPPASRKSNLVCRKPDDSSFKKRTRPGHSRLSRWIEL